MPIDYDLLLQGVQRSVWYLVDVAGDKLIGAFVRIDLNDLRKLCRAVERKLTAAKE